jgi:phosphatidylglycerophosphatase A
MMSAVAVPSFSFLFRHPAHCIALGFGAGLAPAAPGTFGTLLAVPIAAVLRAHFSDEGFFGVIVVFALVGIWAVQVTGRNLGVPDHGAIVWDEVVAFLFVLYFVGDDILRIAVAFAVFRMFDIVKPPPIRQLDSRFKNGFGVMADDLAAAGYTLLVLAIGQRLVF